MNNDPVAKELDDHIFEATGGNKWPGAITTIGGVNPMRDVKYTWVQYGKTYNDVYRECGIWELDFLKQAWAFHE